MNISSKRLITVIATLCMILCMVPFAFADSNSYRPPSLEIELPAPRINTHVANTPQYGDVITAKVYPDTISSDDIRWYRFNNDKYDSEGKLIQKAYYEQVGTGYTYEVRAEDIRHVLKCTVDSYGLVKETEPVSKKNYGEPILRVKDNTYYGDTDGSIYYLDQRMQYSHDGLNIFDVTCENSSLFSGQNLDNLDKNGYSWMVRFKGTALEMESDWVVYTIKAGQKIALEGATINDSALLTPTNSSIDLTLSTFPEHAYIASVEWTSSDESVATVDNNGHVTALSNGEAVITCSLNKGNPSGSKEQSSKCNISVTDFDKLHSADIAMDEISISITESNLVRVLSHAVFPEGIKKYTESWSSSDESVVLVKDGVIEAVGTGEAIITYTVKQNDITVSDTVTVKVLPPPSVDCIDVWSRTSGEDLVVEFTSFPIDNNLVVSIDRPFRDVEPVNYHNYTIDGNKVIIEKEYLYLLGTGDFTLLFTMPKPVEDTEIIENASSSLFSAPIISRLLSYASEGPEISTVGETNDGTVTVFVDFSIANYNVTPHEVTLTPKVAKEYIETDLDPNAITYSVSPEGILDVEMYQYSGGTKAAFRVMPLLVNNTATNTTEPVIITINRGSDSYQVKVNVKGFLNSASFAEPSYTIDYLSKHVKEFGTETKYNPSLSDLLTNNDYQTSIDWTVGGYTSKSNDNCWVDENGKVTATSDTVNNPTTVNYTLTQQSIIYPGGYKTVQASTNLNIKLYELIKRDHLGQWEPLGRVGMNFLLCGIDEQYYDNKQLHPKVYITDSAGNSIPISYYSEDTKFGYRLVYDYEARTVNVELPYYWMRLRHVGTYHITFEFYNKDGTKVEGRVNSTFEVLPKGTPLTGDSFRAYPYIALLLGAVLIPGAVIKKYNKKTRYEGKH